jgi:hypothetical protein
LLLARVDFAVHGRGHYMAPCWEQPGKQQWHLSCAIAHPIRFLRSRGPRRASVMSASRGSEKQHDTPYEQHDAATSGCDSLPGPHEPEGRSHSAESNGSTSAQSRLATNCQPTARPLVLVDVRVHTCRALAQHSSSPLRLAVLDFQLVLKLRVIREPQA